MNGTLDSIFEHFAKSFGTPERTETFTRRPLSREILVHEWPAFGHQMRTYTTDGYSEVEVPGCDQCRRFEFLLSIRDLSFDAAAKVLLSVCAAPLEDRVPPLSGETIALNEPLPGSRGMQRILLTEVPDKERLGLLAIDEIEVNVLLVVPIYESEFGFFRSRGPEHFWAAFRREDLDMTDLQRPCLRAAHEYVVVKPMGFNQ